MEKTHIYSSPTYGAEIYVDLYQLHLKHKHCTAPNPEINYIEELHFIKKKKKFLNKLHSRSSNVQLQFSTSVSIIKSEIGIFQIMLDQGRSESEVKSSVIFL